MAGVSMKKVLLLSTVTTTVIASTLLRGTEESSKNNIALAELPYDSECYEECLDVRCYMSSVPSDSMALCSNECLTKCWTSTEITPPPPPTDDDYKLFTTKVAEQDDSDVDDDEEKVELKEFVKDIIQEKVKTCMKYCLANSDNPDSWFVTMNCRSYCFQTGGASS